MADTTTVAVANSPESAAAALQTPQIDSSLDSTQAEKTLSSDPQGGTNQTDGSQFLVWDNLDHQNTKDTIPPTTAAAPSYPFFTAANRLGAALLAGAGQVAGAISGTGDQLSQITQAVGDAAKQVGGVKTLGDQGRAHGPTPNLQENVNPLGFQSALVDLVGAITAAFSSSNAAQQQTSDLANQLAARADQMQAEVYNELGQLRILMGMWAAVELDVDSLSGAPNPLSEVQALAAIGAQLDVILAGSDVFDLSQGSDLTRQLGQLSNFLLSFWTAASSVVALGVLSTTDAADLTVAAEYAAALAGSCQATLNNYQDVGPYLLVPVFALDPLKGPFVPAGNFQAFDVPSFVAQTGGNSNAGAIVSSLLQNFRPTFLTKALSSYPRPAQDFANNTPNEDNSVNQVVHSIPAMRSAGKFPGSGTKAQGDPNLPTVGTGKAGGGYGNQKSNGSSTSVDVSNVTVGPLSGADWKKYLDVVSSHEGHSYSTVNPWGYTGKWQFGCEALAGEGYMRAAVKTSKFNMANQSLWTGKNGVNSWDDWKADKNNCQEQAMAGFTLKNYHWLMKNGVINQSSSKATVAGYLMAAHLKGATNAKRLSQGIVTHDANGTTTKTYYNYGSQALGGSGGPTAATGGSTFTPGGDEGSQNAATASANTIPDGKMVAFPRRSAAPRYPYNRAHVSESGHILEHDDTPGFERVHHRHRTGTGFEIDANGNLSNVVVRDHYRATLGDDHIMVSGHVHIICDGDVNIKSGGDMNIEAGQNLNITAGGNLVVHAGDYHGAFNGHFHESVRGDSARTVEGFEKVAVVGDTLYDAASWNFAARDSQFNVAANTDINLMGLGNAHLLGKAKVLITSGGDAITSAGGAVNLGGATVNTYGGGNVGTQSGAKILFSSMTASFKTTGLFATYPGPNRAVQAVSVGDPGDLTSQYTYPAASEHSTRQSGVSGTQLTTDVNNFTPVDGKTQAGKTSEGSQTYTPYSNGVSKI